MKTDKIKLGALAEKLAVAFLKKKGYRILAKNWQNKWGEIDIICQYQKTVIFVEVKSGLNLGSSWGPEQHIDLKKQHQLIKMAQIYLSQKRLTNWPWQIDVVSVEFNPRTKKGQINHFKNAIEDNY